MPVAKRPRRKHPAASPWAPPRWFDVLGLAIAGAVAILAIASGLGIGWEWWDDSQTFADAAARGQGSLSRVETVVDERRAMGLGNDPIPTSGPNTPSWTRTGFYTEEIPGARLIRPLQGGDIVIYYDFPSREALKTLHYWVWRFNGDRYGLIVVPKAGLGTTVILAAWTKRLRLDPFDPDAAAAFIDAFIGHGPTNAE